MGKGSWPRHRVHRAVAILVLERKRLTVAVSPVCRPRSLLQARKFCILSGQGRPRERCPDRPQGSQVTRLCVDDPLSNHCHQIFDALTDTHGYVARDEYRREIIVSFRGRSVRSRERLGTSKPQAASRQRTGSPTSKSPSPDSRMRLTPLWTTMGCLNTVLWTQRFTRGSKQRTWSSCSSRCNRS